MRRERMLLVPNGAHFLNPSVLVVSLCMASSMALAGQAAPSERIERSIYISRDGEVERCSIWGNSEGQIKELLTQCRLTGAVDLGRGWKCADARAASEGALSPDPALDWPAFEAGPDEDGTLPTVKEVLTAFFKDRPAYRWRIDTDGFVRIEPADKQKRMDWLLRRRFPKPVTSDVHEEKGWVIRNHVAKEAVRAGFPEWNRLRAEFNLYRQHIGEDDGDVFSAREVSISNLDEFLRLWIAAQPNRYVIVNEFLEIPGTGYVLKRPIFNVHLTSWNAARLKAATTDLVAGLKVDTKAPSGYRLPAYWANDCCREIERRHHFRPEEVVQAIIKSDVGAELYWPLDRRGMFFRQLDERRLDPFLRVSYFAASERDRTRGRTIEDPPLDTFEPADYIRYWEHLASSDDPVLRKHGLARLKKQTPP